MLRSLLILSVLFSIVELIQAQSLNREAEFLYQVLGKDVVQQSFIVYNCPRDEYYSNELMRDTLRHKVGRVDNRYPRFIVLSKKEKRLIKRTLSENPERKWYARHFPGARLISYQTMDSIRKVGPLGDMNMHKLFPGRIYSFVKPIFLSEDLCVFKWDYSCGFLCAYGELNVYRKENGIWKPYLELSSWIS